MYPQWRVSTPGPSVELVTISNCFTVYLYIVIKPEGQLTPNCCFLERTKLSTRVRLLQSPNDNKRPQFGYLNSEQTYIEMVNYSIVQNRLKTRSIQPYIVLERFLGLGLLTF